MNVEFSALNISCLFVHVRVRVTESCPIQGMPLLSAARLRGSRSGFGAVTNAIWANGIGKCSNVHAAGSEPVHGQSLFPSPGADSTLMLKLGGQL
eukprot:366301-Chlamydomonas_euryale.AAC.22